MYYIRQNNHSDPINLAKKIGSGGEGDVHTLTDKEGVCVKIYKDSITTQTLDKLQKMVSHPKKTDFIKRGICWPSALVYKNNTPVGYVMPMASKEAISVRLMFLPMHRKKHLKSFNRVDMCSFLEYWLTTLTYLHSEGILIGDINEANVLVDPTSLEGKSYLVDCDSFQFGTYMCPVGTAEFTPPELQGKNFKTFQRELTHELFSIAVFIFKALVGGKNPYAVIDGESIADNIKYKRFPYPYAEYKLPEYTPAGQWKERWNSISTDIKGLFFKTFHLEDRASVSSWYDVIHKYRMAIKQGDFPRNLDDIAEAVKTDNSTMLDDARRRKSIGESLNSITPDIFGPYIGVLELSTRAVKSMKVDVAHLWGGFNWKKPYFENAADLTYTGQIITSDSNIDLLKFKKLLLPTIQRHYRHHLKDCSHIYAIATAAYRKANNRDSILELLKEENINVKILIRDDEADFTIKAFRWAQTNSKMFQDKDILLVDQGGGSTEITLFDSNGFIIERGNIPLGTESALNTIYDNFNKEAGFLHSLSEVPKYLKDTVNRNTLGIKKAIESRKDPILVALGTAITKATGKDGNAKQHNTIMSLDMLEAFSKKKLQDIDNLKEYKIDTIEKLHLYIENQVNKQEDKYNKKEDTIYDMIISYLGITMYMQLLKRFDLDRLVVCGAGLRYGVAYQGLHDLSRNILGCDYGQGEIPTKLKHYHTPKTYLGITEGNQLDAKVKNITEFGCFVALNQYVDGLIHVKKYRDSFNPSYGDIVRVRVDSIQPNPKKPDKMNISLSLV